MTDYVVVLSENELKDIDAKNLASLYNPKEYKISLIIPGQNSTNPILEILDHLMLLDFKQIWRDVHKKTTESLAPELKLEKSIENLSKQGIHCQAKLIDKNPVEALKEEISLTKANTVIVITAPHPIEGNFHRDWARTAKDKLGIPILHVYSGTSFIAST